MSDHVNHPVHKKWEALRDALLDELRDASEVVVRIPRWEPVGLEEGLNWARSSIYEAFYVAYRVQWSGASATVWMKIWEFGQDEPKWEKIYEA